MNPAGKVAESIGGVRHPSGRSCPRAFSAMCHQCLLFGVSSADE